MSAPFALGVSKDVDVAFFRFFMYESPDSPTVPDHPPEHSLLIVLQDDEKAVKAFGVEYGVQVCEELLAAGAPGLHFYTLNLEKVRIRVQKTKGSQYENSW